MAAFDWKGFGRAVAQTVGNELSKVASRAAEKARDSVLDDFDRVLDNAKERVAGARSGASEPAKPKRATVRVKAKKPKKAAKRPPKPPVIEAEIVEDDDKTNPG